MQVLTSLSGLPISAGSAGYAPTNSADVSAIASAYQVVSATATQLYAGTAYLTSVNGAPVSASRAGNAANASLASSAYYDGTGRLISSLPDSAAVSAIASAYAESAASGKLDYSAVGVDPEMGVVSSIDGAYLSAYFAGYAEQWSDASSKQDTLTFDYDDDKISAINGSALAGGAQVVSSTGTNTSGPFTYIDKINDLTISAKLTYSARSAMYASVDGNGHSISSCISSVSANSAAWNAKLDASASSSFYSTSNPSGFITGVDLSPYQTTAGMTSYIPTSMSSDFQQVTGMSSYVPYSSIGYNTASAISGINGSALAGTTYSAGTGIDITDDVISVEAPVDIVAGPGIVIDNPDGNTLRVSVDQAIETVLWDNYTFANNKAESVAMTETPFNFSQIRITFYIDSTSESWGTLQTQIIDMVALASSTNKYFTLNGTVVNGNDLIVRGSRCKFNGTEIEEHSTIQWYTGGIGPMTQALHIYRIVGVGRTASN